MGKIKILHVITRLDGGGSAENTILTTLGLDKKKYDVVLIKGLSLESEMSAGEKASVEDGLTQIELMGVKLIIVPSLVRQINPIIDLRTLFRLYRIFLREKPIVVHTHTSKAGILGRWASFLAGIPIVVHTPHGHVFYGYYGRIKTKLFILMEKLTAPITDKIITLTEKEKEEHIQLNISKPDKFVVIHSGVKLENSHKNWDNDALRKGLGISLTDSIVGTVGRLVEIKGHVYLLDAARLLLNKMPNTTFLLVGDGHLTNRLKNHALSLGIKEKVVFTGWRNDVFQLINMFDIFVLPSLNEGMGRVLVEAMAVGKPIIASDVGGIPNLVIHGKNGLLVPAADAQALAKSIEFLCANPEKGSEMGKEGKKIAEDYGVGSMLQKIDDLYLRAIKEKFPFGVN